MIKSLSKIALGFVFAQFIFAQPQSASTANEAQILMFNPKAELQSNNPVRSLESTQPRTSASSQPQVSNTSPFIRSDGRPFDQDSDQFKEYQRMEDTTTKPCSGSQDCALSETTIDNPMNQETVDLADPKTKPDIDKILPQINDAGKAAQKNDDTPR